MVWATDAIELHGPRVTIRTTRIEEVPEVVAALRDPGGWYYRQWGITSDQACAAMLEKQIEESRAGQLNPLVYRVGGEVAGITRYMRIEPLNRCLEIGGTWVAPKWRRTFVNTEVKATLLAHCFEVLGAIRVELRVHVDNVTSQNAIKRIGATFEGTMRHRQIAPDGRIGDGLLFSFIAPEWPAAKARLEGLARRDLTRRGGDATSFNGVAL